MLLTQIEDWLKHTKTVVDSVAKPNTETQVEASIQDLNRLNSELDLKQHQLEDLSRFCQEFKKYPDLKHLAETLVEHLRTLTLVFSEQRIVIQTKIETLREHLVQLKETPDLSLENTLDSASMPIEESPVVGVHIETQTGRSLASPQQRDFTVTYNEPVDVQIQTQLSEKSEVEPNKGKETITISKTVIGGEETIQIATKPMAEAQPIVEEPDDLLVEANYRKQKQNEEKLTELNITNANPNQPFETVFVEPDETTTEVIVNADGTKQIIVRKLHRTVVRHQQTVQQQQLTSTSTTTENNQPVNQSFSQVTLKEQESSTTLARGDGSRQTVTSKQYGGRIVSGVPGGDVDVQEFETEPETHVTVDKPSEVEIEGIKLHEGDVTFVDEENKLVPPFGEIHTSSSSVRAVVQQVTRRVIRKTRRIIRKIVIVDGKEQVTEEVVEEPEEVEVTEEGIPRVNIKVTRTEDGKVVQEEQFGEPTVIVEEPGSDITQTVTIAEFEGKPETLAEVAQETERYVVEQTARQPKTSASKDFLENERLALSSNVEAAPSKVEAALDDVIVETVMDKKRVEEQPTPEKSTQIVDVIKETVLEGELTKPDETPQPELTQTIVQTITTPVVNVKEVEKVLKEPETSTTIEVTEKTITQPKMTEEKTVKEEICLSPKLNGDIKLKDITQDFITSQQLHEPEVVIVDDSSDSSKAKKKKKLPKTKKETETPRVQSPLALTNEAVQKEDKNIEIALSLNEETPLIFAEKLVEPTEKPQEVEIALSLEEKQIDSSLVSPQVSMTMTVEENKVKTTPAELIQKDIHVTLPAVSHTATAAIKSVALSPMAPQNEKETVESAITPKHESDHVESPTPSDIDHGGRRSKKKKKHKDEPSSEETEDKEISIATSIAESTEIIVPDDSLPSEETPKPTDEIFEAVITESDEGEGKDTGYEADKTTVDESLADDDKQELRKKKKKKKKQKIKVKESEESTVAKTVDESSPFGDSIQFTDDEPTKTVKTEEPKKSKKKKKGKRGEAKVSESEPEIESEAILSEEPKILEAQSEEIASPNDSYHTLSTQSDLGTVKIIEESLLRPTSESPQEITEKIVTTVPVIEAVFTQENLVQTSPEPDLKQSVEKFIEQEQVSIQTSPEVPKKTGVMSIQTSPEPVPEVIKPEIQESSSQVEIVTSEIVTQTEIPEKVEIVTSETSIQTTNPEKTEEAAQTISPEPVEIPRSESAMQTSIVDNREESVQTPGVDLIESGVQAQATPAEHSMQTSPEPSAPPFEQVFADDVAKETSEIVTQTSPVMIQDITELTPPSSMSEQYEVHVEASVTMPSESTESVSETPVVEISGSSESASDVDVEVFVDGEPVRKPKPKRRHKKKQKKEGVPDIEKDLFAAFKRQESTRGKLDPKELYAEVAKKHSRSSSPAPQEDETDNAVVVGKVITDLDEDKVKKLKAKPKKDEESAFKVSVEVNPEDFEVVSEDVVTKRPGDEDYEVTSTVTLTSVGDFITNEKAAAEAYQEIPPSTEKGKKKKKKKGKPEDESKPVPDELTETFKKEKSKKVAEGIEPKKAVEEIEPKKVSDEIKPEKIESVKPEKIEEIKVADVKPDLEVSSFEEPVKIVQEECVVTSSTPAFEKEVESVQKTPPTLVKENEQKQLSPDMKEHKPKSLSPKTKRKPKHVSSVTIEEIESAIPPPDLPISPPADYPLSPDYSPSRPIWQNRQQASTSLIESERQRSPVTAQDLDIRWSHTQALERAKNLQNARKTTHLSVVLYLATLHEVVTEESIEQRNTNVQENLKALKEAVEKRDVVEIQQTIITTVETITTWLETIEYRIYVNRQQTADGPSKERVQEFNDLKEEIGNIESKVEELQSVMKQADDIYNEDDRKRMKSYIDSLQQQVKVIEEVTSENEQLAAGDLKRWEEFIVGVKDLTELINSVRKEVEGMKESDAAPQTKLNELEKIENANRSNMLKAVQLIATAKGLMRDFPTREIPKEVYRNHDSTKMIEQQIVIEREKALQFLSLADEYEQTLKEFGQIIDVAEALVESPINVSNLEHLEDAMQNHRKFFVNLSHCRAILESLEENLDSETRMHHSELHRNLYDRAKVILDQATGRFQQMSLAASRWTVLEQGMREEMRWLQVAQQRIPDLTDVTSSDYDRYIDLYQSLALDIAHHQARIMHLNGVAQKLQELVVCSGLEEAYIESLEIISKLQDDVQGNLKRLLAFRDLWTSYNLLSDKIEYWLKDAEQQLQQLEVPSGPRGHMRQFWELKAQHEVQNCTRQEATNNLEKALQVVPISDEMIQRKFHTEMQDQWNQMSKRINELQGEIIGSISAPDVPINDKLILLEQELEDLKTDVDNLRGIIKTEEELNLYIERLQVMSTRLETIQNELGRLGLLSATESDKVGSLLSLSKRLELLISEELEGGVLLKERLQNIQKGISRVRRKHSTLNETLDQCEKSEKLGSEAVEKAVNECYEVGEELVTLWQDLMGLRQLLHTLPMRLRVTVSPVKIERDISQLQDDHTILEKRCGQLLAILRNRLALWQRFEHQLELVQQSVQEADFMMELLTVQGTVDYERLRKATERLEVSWRDDLVLVCRLARCVFVV